MKLRKILENKMLDDDDIHKIVANYPGATYRRDGKIYLKYAISISKSPEFCNNDPIYGNRLCVEFGETKSFFMNELKMTSMIGSPDVVDGNYSARHNFISDLEGIPRIITGDLDLTQNPTLISFAGIGKRVKSIGQKFHIPKTIKSNILGLLLIDDIKLISYNGGAVSVALFKSVSIINKHIQGDRDILECQEELITAGYKEFAKL